MEWLRYPGEHSALVLCILSNLFVIAVAVAAVLFGTAWLGAHPRLETHLDTIRTILVGAMLAVPALVLGRRIHFTAAHTGSVRLGEQQFPELYAQFLGACHKLDIDPVPDLYMSREIEGCAVAYSLWGGRSVVVINAEFVDADWAEGLDWLTFVAARALGAIRLGHTRWWIELLTVYSGRIPGLRTPLLVKWAHSRDRCAAFAVPDGIRGLIVEGVGNHALTSVDVPAFVDQTEQVGGFWDRVANITRKRASLVTRARVLYEDGFFDRARDRRRHDFLPPNPTRSLA